MSLIEQIPGLFMQFYTFEEIFYRLEDYGFYDFILPFLLIFAVVFGVLSYTKIFSENKGIHVLISLVIGFLAVRWSIYTDFLNIISPKLAIGLVILLFLIILIGLFTPEGSHKALGWILVGVGFVIFLIILAQTYSWFEGTGRGYISSDLMTWFIIIVLLIGVIVAVVVGNTTGNSTGERVTSALKSLWGEK